MEIKKLSFTKKDLDKIPENERIFFIQMLTLLTELNILIKTFSFYCKNSENETVEKAIQCHRIFVAFINSGKLFEGWKLLEKVYFKNSEQNINIYRKIHFEIDQNGRDYFKRLAKHFPRFKLKKKPRNQPKQKPLEWVRHKLANHYDNDIIKEVFRTYDEEKQFDIFDSTNMSNCFSTIYNSLIDVMAKGVGPDVDVNEAIEIFFKEINESSTHFSYFIREIVRFYIGKYLKSRELSKTVEIPEQENAFELQDPWFY